MMFITVLSFCACTISNKEFESGYFICKYVMEDGKKVGVCILELTELGQEQEILVIPKKINNLPVKEIGRRSSFTSPKRCVQSDKLRKLYVLNHLVVHTDIGSITENNELPLEVIIMYNNIVDAEDFAFISYKRPIVQYFANIEEDRKKIYYRLLDEYYELVRCNVFFHNNYEIEKEVYWIDIINEKKVNMVPPQPKREKFNFTGWYTEKECVNEWNEKFILNSDNELHLYAKWIEN